jgi:hypothetical protein
MAWQQSGSIRGPQGERGPEGPEGKEGPRGEQGIQGERGPEGKEGPQGKQGAPGADGADGRGITISGSVANEAALPTDLGPDDAGSAYLTQDNGKLNVWTGTSWAPPVAFRGPAGPDGAQGVQGDRGPEGPRGPAGADGAQGERGPEGPAGARGSVWFTGAGTPGTVSGAVAGDMYLDTSSGVVYKLA